MKKVFFYSILLLAATACTKQAPAPIDYTLTGKWTYKEYGYSIGGPMIWRNIEPANQVIEFKEDGTFVPAQDFLPGSNRYEKLDSVTLKFLPASSSSGFIKMGYAIDSTTGNLNLWPVDPYCIEGCGNRFVRKNS